MKVAKSASLKQADEEAMSYNADRLPQIFKAERRDVDTVNKL